MKDILYSIAVPLSGIITYMLGYLARRRKEVAKLKALELENYQKVVDFYKDTFEDLNRQIKTLHSDINKSADENKALRMEIKVLNERLSFLK